MCFGHSLPIRLYAHNGRGYRLHCRLRTAATNIKSTRFPGIMIGNHRMIRKQFLTEAACDITLSPAQSRPEDPELKCGVFASLWGFLL
jgi:hypothetical protein